MVRKVLHEGRYFVRTYATDRLITAVVLGLTGAIVAVLLGMPEVALFVAPWVVLGALGVMHDADPEVRVQVALDEDRLLTGDTVELTVSVSSTSDALVRVTPDPSATFVTDSDSRTLSVVEAVRLDRTGEITFAMPALEWGTHDLGAMGIDAVHSYGLFRSRGTIRQRRAVRVHPTPRQLQQLLTPLMVRRVSGTHRSKESAQGIEYADIRQFVAGDSVRDINWRASARTGDLWVSQRHPDRATDVILLVDSFVETGHDVRAIFGLIIDAAISIAENHLSVTDRVGLIEFGGLVRWVSPSTGSVQLQRLTDALLATGLYANAADKELPILPTRALPPRSFIIAFTPLLDQRFVEAVFTARGRGHDVAVIECAPELPGRAEVPQSQEVAARFWEAERAMMRDRMAEHGIAVVAWNGGDDLDVVLGALTRRRRFGRVRGRA